MGQLFGWIAGKILFFFGVAIAVSLILFIGPLRDLALWVNGRIVSWLLDATGLYYLNILGGNYVFSVLLIVVWVFAIALIVRLVAVKLAKVAFGFSGHSFVSEPLRALTVLIAISANVLMAIYAYTQLWGVDVTFGVYTFKGYKMGSTILFSDGIMLGFITLLYIASQLLPLVFDPMKGLIGQYFLDVLFSLPFAVVITLTLIAWVTGSYPGATSIYCTGALKIWSVAVLIDLLHIVLMGWSARHKKERNVLTAGNTPAVSRPR